MKIRSNSSSSSRTSNSNSNKKKRKADSPPFVFTMMGLPLQVRIKILNYFDEKKQEELRNLPVLSKAMYIDCQQLGIVWDFIPEFVLRPSTQEQVVGTSNSGNILTFLQTLLHYQQDENRYNQLQSYRIFRVNNMDKFDPIRFQQCHELVESITENNFRMEGIRLLNISLPPSTSSPIVVRHMNGLLLKALSLLMPNLGALDFSHTGMMASILQYFAENCPCLQKISWHTINCISGVHIDGNDMRYCLALKEVYMDDSTFIFYEFKMSGLDIHPLIFLFHKCGSTVLERLSIRNAKYETRYTNYGAFGIPQNTLIKFVRNAPPTLKWFRSNLTHENRKMLHSERPEIELVN